MERLKVSSISFPHLRNEEHYSFFREYVEPMTPEMVTTLKIKQQFDNFMVQFDIEDGALKKITKSQYTEKIVEADRVRDKSFRGIVDNNRSLINHFDSKKADAASYLQIVFDSYGNIPGKGIAEKGGAYTNIINDLTGERYAPAVKEAGLTEWVNDLAAKNKTVYDLVALRTNETLGNQNIAMSEARVMTDEAFRDVNRVIEALLVIEGAQETGENYRLYIRRLNIIIDKYNAIISGRKGRGANTSDEEKQ